MLSFFAGFAASARDCRKPCGLANGEALGASLRQRGQSETAVRCFAAVSVVCNANGPRAETAKSAEATYNMPGVTPLLILFATSASSAGGCRSGRKRPSLTEKRCREVRASLVQDKGGTRSFSRRAHQGHSGVNRLLWVTPIIADLLCGLCELCERLSFGLTPSPTENPQDMAARILRDGRTLEGNTLSGLPTENAQVAPRAFSFSEHFQ